MGLRGRGRFGDDDVGVKGRLIPDQTEQEVVEGEDDLDDFLACPNQREQPHDFVFQRFHV
jgi:hypothetical protein